MEKPKKSLPPGGEQRLFKRANHRMTVEIQSVSTSESGNVFEVKHERVHLNSCDLSERGMGLRLPFSGKVGSVLKISCRVGPDPKDIVEVFARVMWSKGKKCGVHFLMLENEAREILRGIVRNAPVKKRTRPVSSV
jgi:hypothetical protein